MARIVKSFRIEQEIWDRLEARSGNTSELVRLFIVTGLFKMELPRQTEIEKLCVIEDQTRRIGVNLNQAVKALNISSDCQNALPEIRQACADIRFLRLAVHKLVSAYYGK